MEEFDVASTESFMGRKLAGNEEEEGGHGP